MANKDTRLPDFTPASFPLEPAAECDVIMKGGITSGVIYPLAICELATAYRLRSVGGASAGAIAAAAAAAAEVGRQRARVAANASAAGEPGEATPAATAAPADDALPPGFFGLSRFTDLVSAEQADGKTLLYHLFRPQPGATRLFWLLTEAVAGASELKPKPTAAKAAALVARLVSGLARRARLRVLIGVLPGLLLTALGVLGALTTVPGMATVLAVAVTLLGIASTLFGLIVAVASAVVADLRRVPRLGFGISSGRGASDRDLALTPWLYERLQDLADEPYDRPLTIGDLREHRIDLQVMTTNLSRRQPIVMPWNDHTYFYSPTEFRALFGDTVVAAMKPPAPPADAEEAVRWEHVCAAAAQQPAGLLPFPAAADLPVIVATRMSLSFPLLISAVPLYAVDWSRATNSGWIARVEAHRRKEPGAATAATIAAAGLPDFDKNWFSDGGLTSNLPVHFFDAPLPSRPTFAIDLSNFDPGVAPHPDQRRNSFLPTRNVPVRAMRRTHRWEDDGPMSQLLSFGVSLVETARTWVDEASLVMPGYRDRVVTVYQSGEEGGLNLSMQADTVRDLSDRGRFAGQKLVARFGQGGAGWPNHQWLRFRTATAALNDWLIDFDSRYRLAPHVYDDVLAGTSDAPSYPIAGELRLAAARARLEALRTQLGDWGADPVDAFTDGRPQQPPVLRLVPRPDAQS